MSLKIKPMLCQEAEQENEDASSCKAFHLPGYVWETKFDGARIVVTIKADGSFELQGRSGADKTKLFPELQFNTKIPCVLDGEIISGSSFNDIQHRINRQSGIEMAAKTRPATFKAFDILQADYHGNTIDLRHNPLTKRREALEEIVIPTNSCELSEMTDDGLALFLKIRDEGGEGVVGKNIHGHYVENKREWLKVKTWQFGVFQAVGYTEGTGWRKSSFGALALANADNSFVGEVGTGFKANDIRDIQSYFSPGVCPWSKAPIKATWIKPFSVRIRYLEFTADGKLRFPSYRGII